MKNLKSIKKALFVAFSSLALVVGLIAAPFSAFAQDYNKGGNKSEQRNDQRDSHRDNRASRGDRHRDNRDRNREDRNRRHERERRDRDRHERERRDRDRHERERRDRDDRHRRHREFREDDRFIVIDGLRYYVRHDGRGPYIRFRGIRYYLDGDTVVIGGTRYDLRRN